MGLLTLLRPKVASLFPPPSLYQTPRGVVCAFGATGSFGEKTTGLLGSGQSFQVIPVHDWSFGKGVSEWFPAVMSDGKVIIPGQPLTTNAFFPTADHMEYTIFDPETQLIRRYHIPTSAGRDVAIELGQTVVGGGDVEDAQVVFLGGEEMCVLTSGKPYQYWHIALGFYPSLAILRKIGNEWVYDAARSATADALAASNPSVASGVGSFPDTINTYGEHFKDNRNISEVGAPLLHSNALVVGQYDDDRTHGHNSGLISVINPTTMTLLASFQVPNITDSESSPIGYRPREIQTDPSSDLDDERIVVISDTFFRGPGTVPMFSDDFESGITGYTSVFGSAVMSVVSSTSHSATHSLKMVAAFNNPMESDPPISRAFPCIAGNVYGTSAWVRPDAAETVPKNAAIGIKWFDGQGDQFAQTNGFPLATVLGSFTRIFGDLTAPANAVSGIPFVFVFSDTAGQAYEADDLVVIANNPDGAQTAFCIQEFSFKASTNTITAISAPILSSQLANRYEACCFDQFGTLFIGQVPTHGFPAMRDTAIYMKRNGARRYVADAPADGTWVSAGTTTQWGVRHTPDYFFSPDAFTTSPVGMFVDNLRKVLVIPSSDGVLQGIKFVYTANGMVLSRAWAPINLVLDTLTDRTQRQIIATKPIYDVARSKMWWPIRGQESVSGWPGTNPHALDQWLYSVNIAALLVTSFVQPTRLSVDIADRRRQAIVQPSARRTIEVLHE